MDYFLSIDNSEIKKLYLPIVELLEEKKYQGIVSSIRKRLTTIGQQLVALANTIGVNSKKKIELKKELDIIEKDMNTNSVDDPSLAELLSNNKQLVEHVKEQKIFPGRKEGFKGNNPQQRQTSPRTIGAVQQSGILSEDPEATKDGLSLYLARLSQAFINQEIKKTPGKISSAKLAMKCRQF